MKRVLLVATVVKKHIMQFHQPLIAMLVKEGWTVDVAASNDYDSKAECQIPNCSTYYDIPFERNPLHKKNIEAYHQLKEIINTGNYDVIHCNTPVGGIIARLAARDARKKGTKVIYMAHGFHFYKGAPLKNWLLYYPAEKFCSRMTDVLMTINKEDYTFSCKRMHAIKNEYVPGIGIDLNKFSGQKADRKETGRKIILSVGELIERKNHEAVIRAIHELKDMDIEYRICGDGELKEYLQNLSWKLGLEGRVKFLGYRKDIPEQLSEADLFILPSFQEGLPVALMEAMASRTMVIASDIRGNTDLLPKELLFRSDDISGIAEKIRDVLQKDNIETINANYEHLKDFSEPVVLAKMKEIYDSLLT